MSVEQKKRRDGNEETQEGSREVDPSRGKPKQNNKKPSITQMFLLSVPFLFSVPSHSCPIHGAFGRRARRRRAARIFSSASKTVCGPFTFAAQTVLVRDVGGGQARGSSPCRAASYTRHTPRFSPPTPTRVSVALVPWPAAVARWSVPSVAMHQAFQIGYEHPQKPSRRRRQPPPCVHRGTQEERRGHARTPPTRPRGHAAVAVHPTPGTGVCASRGGRRKLTHAQWKRRNHGHGRALPLCASPQQPHQIHPPRPSHHADAHRHTALCPRTRSPAPPSFPLPFFPCTAGRDKPRSRLLQVLGACCGVDPRHAHPTRVCPSAACLFAHCASVGPVAGGRGIQVGKRVVREETQETRAASFLGLRRTGRSSCLLGHFGPPTPPPPNTRRTSNQHGQQRRQQHPR